METRSNLERKTQKLMIRNNVLIVLLTLCVGYIVYDHVKNNNSDILYTKGIVIVDEEGRDRILIGASIPKSKDRIRDDNDKAMKAWADYFDPKYKEWYKTYDHENYGMLILDENGHDRVAVGKIPDPNIGKRIGPGYGIAINDEEGFERSAYNLIKTKNGKNRVVLGLDNNNGTEGLSLILSDEGNTGLIMKSDLGEIFIGKTEGKNPYIDVFPFKGLMMKNDSLKNKFEMNVLEKK